MSVINQMLQDLETRRGAIEGQNVEPVPVRAAGVVHERRVSPVLIGAAAVGVVIIAAAAWWLLRGSAAPTAAPDNAPSVVIPQPAQVNVTPVAQPQPATPAAPPAITATQAAPGAPLVEPAPAAPVASKVEVPKLTESNAAAAKPALPDRVVPTADKPSAPAKLAALSEAPEAPVAAAAPEKLPAPPPAARAPLKSLAERSNAPIPGMETGVQNFKQRNPQQRIDERYRDALRKLNEGQFAAARADLNEVLQTQPKHSGARLALVGIELEEKRSAQAEKLLRDGIQLQPGENAFSMALARLEVERGDVDAALSTLGRAQSSTNEDADYHGFYAALLQRAGRHAEAVEHYQLALRQREAANWLIGLGISLEAANRARDAEQIYRRAQQSAGLTPELQDFANQRLQQLRR